MSRVYRAWAWLALAPTIACDSGPEHAPGLPSLLDAAHEPDQDAGLQPDASQPAFEPPRLRPPDEQGGAPYLLSQTGLYTNMEAKIVAPDLLAFEPRFPLWSDGADKRRWLRLPADARIDSTDPDHLRFPEGTVLFKEFSRHDKRLETRVIAKLGPSDDDFWMGAFVWRDDESDAEWVPDGATDVRDTDHDVPTEKRCGTCHNGEPGRVLGFAAVQLTALPSALLTAAVAEPQLVADDLTVRALGYLHANCGHCHNPMGSARPDTDMNLRLPATVRMPAEAPAYLTTRNLLLQYFQGSAARYRMVPGDPEASGLLLRMQSRGPRTQMPPIATEHVDHEGVQLIQRWIAEMP